MTAVIGDRRSRTAGTRCDRTLRFRCSSLYKFSRWRFRKQRKRRKRTCEHPRRLAHQIADHPPSLFLDRTRRFTSIPAHTTDLTHHTEITLQVVPKTKYELSLLVDNEKKELREISDGTWEPAKPLYALVFFTRAHTEACAYIETHVPHPRCASRFK